MSTTNQNQTKLQSFEELRKIEKDDCVLVYDGDLDGTLTVINQTKGTMYTIEDGECDCKGFQYRSECKHIDGLEELRE